jgi:hypothetical protein
MSTCHRIDYSHHVIVFVLSQQVPGPLRCHGWQPGMLAMARRYALVSHFCPQRNKQWPPAILANVGIPHAVGSRHDGSSQGRYPRLLDTQGFEYS